LFPPNPRRFGMSFSNQDLFHTISKKLSQTVSCLYCMYYVRRRPARSQSMLAIFLMTDDKRTRMNLFNADVRCYDKNRR
jgi:hypothetical protein